MSAATETTELHESFLLNQFNGFYEEVIRQKAQVKRRPFPLPEIEVTPEIRDEKAAADPIWHRLLGLLERQVAEARSRGGEYGVAFYQEAQYVMAALADEVFIHTEWEGRHAWKSNLLEFKLFGSNNAGERLFEKIDRLLKANDPSHAEMAAVYLQALSLGFRGKYRDTEDGGMLAFYQRQLFHLIFQRQPSLEKGDGPLFPQPYAHTLNDRDMGTVGAFRWWPLVALGVVMLFLLVSHLIWSVRTDEIQRITEIIIRESGGGPP